MPDRFLERCSASPVIRKTQIKTTVRRHLVSVKVVSLREPTNNKCWQGRGEKREPSRTAGGNVSWYSRRGRHSGDFSNIKTRATQRSHHSALGYTSKENESTHLKRYTHPDVHNSAIYKEQDTEATCVH